MDNFDNNHNNNDFSNADFPNLNNVNTDLNSINSNQNLGNNSLNDGNNMENSSNDGNIDNKQSYNPYRNFLPENRIKRENGNISPKVVKGGLYGFYSLVFLILVVVFLKFTGHDVLKVESRNYNMNMSETINLENLYSSPNVVWTSNSDNVIVNNNVIVAVKPGVAYIVGTEDNKIVKDVNINVLNANQSMYINEHDINISLDGKGQINVTKKISGNTNPVNGNNSGFIGSDNANIFSDDEEEGFDFDSDFSSSLEEDLFETDTEIEDVDYYGDEYEEDEYLEELEQGDDLSNDEYSLDDDFSNPDDSEESVSEVNYESSNEKIAKVDDKGNIEPISPGTVIITVTDDMGNEDHAYVTIAKEDIELYNDEYQVVALEKVKIEYNLGVDYKDEDIVWSSDNENVAVVDKGIVTGVSVGETTIRAKVGDNSAKTIKISVMPPKTVMPSSISLSSKNVVVFVGESFTVSAVVLPDNTTDKKLNWVSSDLSIASVKDGVISGVKEGNAVVSVVTSNSIKEDINVVVKKKIILDTDISFDNAVKDIKIGESFKLNYIINPRTATNKNVKLDYDTNYLTISSSGMVTALKVGSTTITAITANNNKTSMQVNIIKPNIDVSSVEIKEKDFTLTVGAYNNLTVNVLPSDATNKTVSWKSSDPKIASVDSLGKVTALKVGTVTITATSGSVSNSIKVTVVANTVKVSSVSFSEKNISLLVGKSKKVGMTVLPNNASNKSVSWKSSNSKVASVDSSGNVLAISKGTATITAVSNDNSSIKASVVVTVNYNLEMSLSVTDKVVNIGDSYNIVANILPEGANKDVKYSVADSKIATVDNKGKVVAKAVGTTYITVTSVEDVTKSLKSKIEVRKKAVTSVKSSDSNKTVKYGDSYKMNVVVSPSNASNKQIVYSSNNKSIATVDNNGNVKTTSKMGIVTITAKSKDNPKAVSRVVIKNVPKTGMNGESSKTYTQITKLGTLNLKKAVKVVGTDDVKIAQGFCVYQNYYITALRDKDEKKVLLKYYNKKNGNQAKAFVKKGMGHVNGMTHSSYHGKVYVIRGNGWNLPISKADRIFYSFIPDKLFGLADNTILTKKNIMAGELARGGDSIAYDSATQMFYIAHGSKIYLYNNKFKLLSGTINKLSTGTVQDIGGYNGMIFVIRYVRKNSSPNRNWIDIYRVSDGKYLGSYNMNSSHELESIDYYGSGNKFSLFFNVSGDKNNYIYTTESIKL